MTEKSGWANVEQRQLEKEMANEEIPEDIERQMEVEAQLYVAPMYMVALLKEMRDLMVTLTNEIKVANSQVLDNYELELVEPNEFELPDAIVEVDEESVTTNPTAETSATTIDYSPEMEESVEGYYREILRDYESPSGKMYTDEELKKFNFGIGEDNVIMKYDGWINNFGHFAQYVEENMGGRYKTGKGFILPKP